MVLEVYADKRRVSLGVKQAQRNGRLRICERRIGALCALRSLTSRLVRD